MKLSLKNSFINMMKQMLVFLLTLILTFFFQLNKPTDVKAFSNNSPYGMNTALFWSDKSKYPVDKWEEIINKMEKAGVKYNRTTINWAGIQKSNYPNSNNWNWIWHDRQIESLNKHNISPLGYFMFTPEWAKKDPSCTSRWENRICAPNLTAWKNFITETVKRYGCGSGGKCQIKYWELWNEPDLNKIDLANNSDCQQGFFCGTVDDYFAMMWQGYKAIKNADPQAKVVMGGISQLGIHPNGFLDQLLTKKTSSGYSAGYFFDIFNFHYYYTNTTDLLGGLNSVKELRSKYNLQSKPIWITEINKGGSCSKPSEIAKDISPFYQLLLENHVEKIFWFKVDSQQNPNNPSSDCYQHPGILSGLDNDFSELQPMYDEYQKTAEERTLTTIPTFPQDNVPPLPPTNIISQYNKSDKNVEFKWGWSGDATCSGCEEAVGYCSYQNNMSSNPENLVSCSLEDEAPFWWQIVKAEFKDDDRGQPTYTTSTPYTHYNDDSGLISGKLSVNKAIYTLTQENNNLEAMVTLPKNTCKDNPHDYYRIDVDTRDARGNIKGEIDGKRPNVRSAKISCCKESNQGNADCNDQIDNTDYNIWACEYNNDKICDRQHSKEWSDFNLDNKVDLIDFEIWREGKED